MSASASSSVSAEDLRLDLFVEAFNLFDQNSFATGFSQRNVEGAGPLPDDFGIPSGLVTRPRQLQVGARFSF